MRAMTIIQNLHRFVSANENDIELKGFLSFDKIKFETLT